MRNHLSLIVLIVVAGGFAALPSVPGVGKNTLDLLITLFIIASLASSWNILAGMTGRINLGHVAFFGLGTLTTRELWLTWDLPLPVAFIAGGLAAALAAVVVGFPALRLRGTYFAVGTLAMAEALRLTVSTNFPLVSRLPGPMLRSYNETFELRYFVALGVLVVIVAFVYWLKRSKIGLGMMAIRNDEEAARSIGINVFRHTMFAFIASAFFAGLTGSSFAYFGLSYYPSLTFGPVWTFDAMIVTYIGGIGTLAGPLIGAFFFVLVRNVLAANLVNIHLVIFGIVFIIVVLAVPGGFVDIFNKLVQRVRSAAAPPDVEQELVKNV